jgi:hypothetical protein
MPWRKRYQCPGGVEIEDYRACKHTGGEIAKMALSQHIAIRHNIPSLKGRILDIPGGELKMLDPNGKVLANGFSLKLTGSQMIQPDPTKAPYEVATIKVTKATAEGGRATYNVTQPVTRVLEQFFDVLRDAVGADADFDATEKYDALLLLTLAASSKDTQHLAPTHNTAQWTEDRGWMDHGTLVCSAPVEVCREISTASGEKTYRLRVPSLDRPGFFDYSSCTLDELNAGDYKFSERRVSVPHAIKSAHAILERWSSLTEGQKVTQEHDEYTEPSRRAQEQRNRQFSVRGREGR